MTKKTGSYVGALLFLLVSLGNAQAPNPVLPITLFNRKLVSTTLQALGSGGVLASCPNAGCSVSTPLFAPVNIRCPVATGKTCTYFVQGFVPLTVGESINEIGFIQFCGDEQKVCAPGEVNEVYSWAGAAAPSAYSFVIVVTNTTANQKHRVEVAIGCYEGGNSDGCFIEEAADAVGNHYNTGRAED